MFDTLKRIFEEAKRPRWRVLVAVCFLSYGLQFVNITTNGGTLSAAFHRHNASFSGTSLATLDTTYAIGGAIAPAVFGLLVDHVLSGPQCGVVLTILSFIASLLLLIGVAATSFAVVLMSRIAAGLSGDAIFLSQLYILARWFQGGFSAYRGFSTGCGCLFFSTMFSNVIARFFSDFLFDAGGGVLAAGFAVGVCVVSVIICLVLLLVEMRAATKGLIAPRSMMTSLVSTLCSSATPKQVCSKLFDIIASPKKEILLVISSSGSWYMVTCLAFVFSAVETYSNFAKSPTHDTDSGSYGGGGSAATVAPQPWLGQAQHNNDHDDGSVDTGLIFGVCFGMFAPLAGVVVDWIGRRGYFAAASLVLSAVWICLSLGGIVGRSAMFAVVFAIPITIFAVSILPALATIVSPSRLGTAFGFMLSMRSLISTGLIILASSSLFSDGLDALGDDSSSSTHNSKAVSNSTLSFSSSGSFFALIAVCLLVALILGVLFWWRRKEARQKLNRPFVPWRNDQFEEEEEEDTTSDDETASRSGSSGGSSCSDAFNDIFDDDEFKSPEVERLFKTGGGETAVVYLHERHRKHAQEKRLRMKEELQKREAEGEYSFSSTAASSTFSNRYGYILGWPSGFPEAWFVQHRMSSDPNRVMLHLLGVNPTQNMTFSESVHDVSSWFTVGSVAPKTEEEEEEDKEKKDDEGAHKNKKSKKGRAGYGEGDGNMEEDSSFLLEKKKKNKKLKEAETSRKGSSSSKRHRTSSSSSSTTSRHFLTITFPLRSQHETVFRWIPIIASLTLLGMGLFMYLGIVSYLFRLETTVHTTDCPFHHEKCTVDGILSNSSMETYSQLHRMHCHDSSVDTAFVLAVFCSLCVGVAILASLVYAVVGTMYRRLYYPYVVTAVGTFFSSVFATATSQQLVGVDRCILDHQSSQEGFISVSFPTHSWFTAAAVFLWMLTIVLIGHWWLTVCTFPAGRVVYDAAKREYEKEQRDLRKKKKKAAAEAAAADAAAAEKASAKKHSK